MKLEETLARLSANQHKLKGFPLRSLSIFGSVARDEAKSESDVDILVEFEPQARIGLFEFVRLQLLLSEILEAPVDLATPAALRPEMRDQILGEAIRAT
jgi:predicted nucleotidyltransferase